MKKKTRDSRTSLTEHELNWRTVPTDDLFLVARAFHQAANKLADSLYLVAGPFAAIDVAPVLSTYRSALEYQLKAIVLGRGGSFLKTTPDLISVMKSRSLSWLAQTVSQMIRVLKWEDTFRCEGVQDLTGFKSLIEEMNEIDPCVRMFRISTDAEELRLQLVAFLRRLDALLDLLEATADALHAEWDLRTNGMDDVLERDLRTGFDPTIH